MAMVATKETAKTRCDDEDINSECFSYIVDICNNKYNKR